MMDKQEQLNKLFARQMMTIVASYAKLPDFDLTSSQYFILQALFHEKQLTSSYFSRVLDITLPAVSNLSNKLVRKGLVERVVSETDRRQVYLQLTDHGRHIHERMLEKYQTLTDGLWSDLTEAEKDLLITSYERITELLQLKNSTI
ncbi:MarR family transcriptional regulator [Paenibacillus sp. NPDC058174]|uniref:MarR family transcriptional regulator n=1 Tax=Paenibacillus sp. NPDC058174 TaxID=3346366 RepID=UPI0036D8A2A0